MRGIWRLLRIALLAAVVAAGALAAALYILAARSLPSYSGDRTAKGLGASVEIVRDRRAVPHIFAESEADAYFALGYVHAQDRLWQMELHRRLVEGRLTEFAGAWGRRSGRTEEFLRIDIAARSLDLAGRAERSLAAMSPRTRAVLDAYAAGVNAWLAEVDEGSLGRGAPELFFLGAEIAPWRARDSVAAFKLLAAFRSAGVFDELTRARFLTSLGPERVADLFPPASGPALMALPAFGAAASGAAEGEAARGNGGAAGGFVTAVSSFFSEGGSNIWAAAGTRSATRAPLMASDPHMPIAAPGIWYIARMSFPRPTARRAVAETPVAETPGAEAPVEKLDLIGATAPGAPAVLYGRSAEIAWGSAGLAADVGDVFIERVDPNDPSRYLTPQGWAPFKVRETQIPIGEGKAVLATLRETRHGPVLPLDWPEVAAATPKDHVAALSWTVLAEDDRSLEAALRVSRARDALEALAAAESHVAPPQILLAADRRSIAMAAIGRTPLRRADSLSRGLQPGNGWSAENDWLGWVSPLDLPRAIDPPSGLLANANNRVPNAPFPRHIGQDWAEPYRLTRLSKLLNIREFHTLSGFQSIQTDTVSEMARGLLPLIAEDLWRVENIVQSQEAGPAGDESGGAAARLALKREALRRLSAWNGDMDGFLAEPLIFSAWMRALSRRLTLDDLGPLAPLYQGQRPLFLEKVFKDRRGAGARWCDDVRTPEKESCEQVASLALDDAIGELAKTYGASMDSWRWGRAHQAVHRHEAFGDTPLLSWLLNIRQETGGGDHTLQRGVSAGSGPEPYVNRVAGGFRAIYDFADLDRSVFSMANGQSGHFLSRHYDDFAEMWRGGDYVPMSLAREDAEAGSVGVLRLSPPTE